MYGLPVWTMAAAAMIETWYFPHNTQQLMQFYVVICLVYLLIHLFWDWRSTETPPFSLKNIKYRADLVFSGATFASSLFYILIMLDLENPLRTADIFIMPMLLSGFSGMMLSLANLVPEPRKQT